MRNQSMQSMRRTTAFGIMVFCLCCLLTSSALSQESTAENSKPDKSEGRSWWGVMGSYGRHTHIWSSSVYVGYKTWSAGAFYEWESPRLTVLPFDVGRNWRVEFRYAKLWGTIPLDPDQVTDEVRAEGPPFWTKLDHQKISIVGVRRWIFLPDSFIRPSLFFGFGMSLLDDTIIEDGSVHNFDFVGGAGIDVDIAKRWILSGEARFEHFSNGGQIGLTNSDVIGPESLNMVLCVLYQY